MLILNSTGELPFHPDPVLTIVILLAISPGCVPLEAVISISNTTPVNPLEPVACKFVYDLGNVGAATVTSTKAI